MRSNKTRMHDEPVNVTLATVMKIKNNKKIFAKPQGIFRTSNLL